MFRKFFSVLKKRKEKGVIIVTTALLLPVLFAFTGIAFDIGRLYLEKGRMQHMADAAVLAGLADIKKEKFYKSGSGKLVMTIPIGALPYTLDNTRELRERADASANKYLMKNSGDPYFQIENEGADSELYFLRSGDADDDSSIYYYEVILKKTFPLTFGRIVYGKDITVRAGAVCIFELVNPESIYTYAYARENWSHMSKEDLLKIDSVLRLKVDREALTRFANMFLGKNSTWLNATIGTDNPGKLTLLGHYEEKEVNGEINVSYTPYQGAVPGKTLGEKFMGMLQGDESGITGYNSNERYLFSDYAVTHVDGFKMTLTIKNNTVTAVHLQPNPADAGNGSGALMIDVP